MAAWVLALLAVEAPGASGSTPWDENALGWMLFLGLGWNLLGGFLMHTIWAKPVAKQIGWETNGFQHEVGFASLGMGAAAIVASFSDSTDAWLVASIAGGTFLLLAGANHIREIVRDRNYAPGNTVILLSDLGMPISLAALLISANAI